jgi:hypothetical protein
MSDDWVFEGWYYEQGGQQIGPVSNEEIARLVTAGRLTPQDEILKSWTDGRQRHFFKSRVSVALGLGDHAGPPP